MYSRIKHEINNILQEFERQKKITSDEKGELLTKISAKVISQDCAFSVSEKELEERKVYEADSIETGVYLKLLNNYLKKYSDYLYTERKTAIQLIMNESQSDIFTHVLKLDIEKFYNSIDILKLKEMLGSKNSFYHVEYSNLLNLYFKKAEECNSILPGLSPSNILAEIYAKKLDEELEKFLVKENVKYSYIRYVDDIFLLLSREVTLRDIVPIFKNLNLKLNSVKSCLYPLKEDKGAEISFLGYEFIYSPLSKHISITDDKLKKIIDKVSSLMSVYTAKSNCFGSYSKTELDSWFYHIYKHIMYIRVYKKTNSIIYTGFAHSYSEICNKFGFECKKDNGKRIEIDKKIKNKLSVLKSKKPHFFLNSQKYMAHMLPSHIIKSKKKLIFLDDVKYFNKRKIIKFLKLHSKIMGEEFQNLDQESYYKITSLYHEKIKKVLNI